MRVWGGRGEYSSFGMLPPHPNQVFKNRKMAGRMGGKQRTIKSVWVYKVDPARSLLWVRGQVRLRAFESKATLKNPICRV